MKKNVLLDLKFTLFGKCNVLKLFAGHSQIDSLLKNCLEHNLNYQYKVKDIQNVVYLLAISSIGVHTYT
ncbi:hypothetical protein BpHYR1_041347 [Brachionus plicatilis]|uniref:Uncharacterized protein n=1 Tax=Brachionus plicatilis TaxID=10195 RepID=A0A3M7PM46_BRAPC|nr:hypothetical protein BpHYR1_041347 [Brachionus plicatilis]